MYAGEEESNFTLMLNGNCSFKEFVVLINIDQLNRSAYIL